jgi:acyl-CoA thioester hydrolase
MNVVWHGNYARYFEEVRSALLDKIGHNYHEMLASNYAWPIVDMRIKYLKPLKLHQDLRVEATLIEYENRLKIDYRIYDNKTDTMLTKAMTIQVAVNMATQEMQFETPEVFQNCIRRVLR